jgi:hypothetical protein
VHINVKELSAAINTVKSLSKAGETVSLSVDKQVIYYLLEKGGEGKSLQRHAKTIFSVVHGQKHNTNLKWIPLKECLADPISRWEMDRGDYSLDPQLFLWLKNHYKKFIDLKTDLFAAQATKN